MVRLGDGEDLASRLYREEDRRGWLLEALASAPVAPKVRRKAEDGAYRRKAADRTRQLLAKGIDPERLELAELLDRLVDYIQTYVVLPVVEKGDERYERAVGDLLALWVVHGWTFPAWWATPYLRVTSAAPESAKSLLLEVLASVSRRAWLAVNPSSAVLYRKIDRDEPTLLLDELDNFDLAEKRDALAVLNAGYKPGAKVPRCSDSGELEEFSCYCPKAFAAIDVRQMPPALLSRSVTIRMEPRRAGDPVESYIAPDAGPRAEELRECCRAWAERHVDELKGRRPDLVGLTNRRAEVWWPLLVLGEHAGGEWQDRAREAARAFGAGGDETDRPAEQVQLLMDIDTAFGDSTAIFTADLLTYLNNLDESPWGDRRRGEGLDARGLATLLRPFKIRPRTVRVGNETAKGYHLDQFADAFGRYLPIPALSVTSVTSVTTAPLSQADVTDVTDVTVQRSHRRLHPATLIRFSRPPRKTTSTRPAPTLSGSSSRTTSGSPAVPRGCPQGASDKGLRRGEIHRSSARTPRVGGRASDDALRLDRTRAAPLSLVRVRGRLGSKYACRPPRPRSWP